MSNQNVFIKSVGTYLPDNKVDNSYFIEHFNKMGLECEGLMKHLGRKTRYLVDHEEENALTMAYAASQAALKKANLEAKDLDIIVFISDTPEYLVPTNALMLNALLGASNAHIVYDLNVNCMAFIPALDQVNMYLKAHNLKHALIAGGILTKLMSRIDDTVTYTSLSDGGGALILERKEEEEPRGIIGAKYYSNAMLNDKVRFPASGMSRILNSEIDSLDKQLTFVPHDVSFFSTDWKNLIEQLLHQHQLSKDQVDHFLFSQYSRDEITETLEKLNVPMDRTNFVGEEFGYPGASSIIFALEDALNRQLIKEGDNVVFCAVGSGYVMGSLLYKF